MALNKALFSSDKEDWATPQDFFDSLNEEFHFNLDPCADPENAKCDRFFTKEENGLSKDWGGSCVFCNPPYGRKTTGEWKRNFKQLPERRSGAWRNDRELKKH